MDKLNEFLELIKQISSEHIVVASLLLFTLPIIEALLPFLPLFVIAGAMTEILGVFLGFILLSTSTILGAVLVYLLVKYFFREKFHRKIANSKYSHLPEIIDNASDFGLILILIFPFTPSFLLNYSFALSNMEFKRYFKIIIISKLVLCVELAYLGQSFINFKDSPVNFVVSVVIFVMLYLGSKIISNKIANKK